MATDRTIASSDALSAGALVAGLICNPAVAADPSRLHFADVTAEFGIDFVHSDFRDGAKHYVETTASGGGWLDIDGDGDLDLYLLNGAPPPESGLPAARNRLYENRVGRFVDVTEATGTGDTGFGMGLCVGDIDGDGAIDFFVTNYGPDRLYRNLGNGRFEEVARASGVAGDSWSTSCAFGDFDGDGDHDLYVTHYVNFRYGAGPVCGNVDRTERFYCQPTDFRGVADALFINRGDGTFDSQAARRGLMRGDSERGMGVLASDLDHDGDLDLYISNDGSANRLYENDGEGFFRDVGLTAGVALNGIGDPEAGMGIDAGDVDGDGNPDLFVTHFALETNTLYIGGEGLQFADATRRSGLGRPAFLHVGWGTRMFDADNDGDLDLAIANGHMQEGIEKTEPSLHYAQPDQIFENLGDGRFRDASLEAGAPWARTQVSRGLAAADFNEDGRLDLLITTANGAPRLLENRSQTTNHWFGLRLLGPPDNRLALGARVEIEADGRRQWREVRSGSSFQSQSDLRLHFGLGSWIGSVTVTVHWPNGRRQQQVVSEVDSYSDLEYVASPEP